MEYLTVDELLSIHRNVIDRIGGSHGIRDMGALESAVSQPAVTFGGDDLYVGVVAKASALGFSLITNHPFIDGNKRVGYVATRVFLMLNGFDIAGRTDDKEAVILAIASGNYEREQFELWLYDNINPKVACDT